MADRTLFRLRAAIALAFLFGNLVAMTAGNAQEPSKADMVKALRQPAPTRGLSDGLRRADPAEGMFMDAVRQKPSQALTQTERGQVAALAKKRPGIDLEINFRSNSSVLDPAAARLVSSLGEALSDASLSDSMFLIGGHTDAKGKASHNQRLAVRRAEAVKSHLARRYKISPSRLMAVGYGSEQLKDANDPYAAANRRVQIVNMGDVPTAQRR